MTDRSLRLLVSCLLCSVLSAGAASAQGVNIDADVFGGLGARAIGPAVMSGRVAALDAVAGDRLTIYVGSAGGGVWKSVDGGLRFKPIFDKYNPSIGAVTIDPSNPKTVCVGTGETWTRNSVSVGDGVYKSVDAGDSWTRVGLRDSERIARILVHPKDSNTVLVCATGHLFDDHPERGVFRTKDGGKTWEKVLFVAPDVGCADLAMDPADPNLLYAGMWQFRRRPDFFTSGGPKGGLYRSTDGGTTWTMVAKGLPAGDIGRIALATTPARPGLVYATVEARKTGLYRSEDRGDTWVETSTASAVAGRPFYFSRLVADPKDANRVYKCGTQISVSDDGGKTFSVLGSGNVFGPSYHSDIHDVWISPKDTDELIIGNASVIWAGTDDGNLQVTRDGGKTWRNAAANVPGLPKNTWVSSVEASHVSDAVAYATFDGHMTGDMKTYVFKTSDYGQTWQAIAPPDMRGYAHVVKEDLVNPDLLFVGTEFGLWISVDGGRQWGQFTAGLPAVAVRDLAIHPREHDLILATHGRGLYIVDDITPLRKLTAAVLDSEVAFLESRPSPMVIQVMEFGFNGDAEFVGQSPGETALITYYLKRRHMFGDLKLEVYDRQGRLLTAIPGGKRRGLNRVEWPMRAQPPRTAPGAGFVPNLYALLGPRVPEGTYAVKLIKDKDTFTSEVRLVPDPRSTHSAADRAQQQETVWKLYRLVERLAYLVDAIADARAQARARVAKLPAADALRKPLEPLANDMEARRTSLVASKQGEGISGEEKLREELGSLYGNVNGYDGRPTDSQINRMGLLANELDDAVAAFDQAIGKGAGTLNAQLTKKKLDPIVKLTPEEWEKRAARR